MDSFDFANGLWYNDLFHGCFCFVHFYWYESLNHEPIEFHCARIQAWDVGVAIYVSLFPFDPVVGQIAPVSVNLDGTKSYMALGIPDFPTGDSCLYTWFSQEGLENAQHSIKITREVGPQDPAVAKGCPGISRFM